MSVELKVPEVGESITEVEIARWLKAEGDAIARDEALVEIDSDKVSLEIPSPISGTLKQIMKQAGEGAKVGEVICLIDEAGEEAQPPAQPEKKSRKTEETEEPEESGATEETEAQEEAQSQPASELERVRVMPSVRREMEERDSRPETIPAEKAAAERETAGSKPEKAAPPKEARAPQKETPGRGEETVRMSAIRRRIAERLVEAQKSAALLTTFNEIDMSAVIGLRQQQRDAFQEKHGVKLGFMSFFVKAAIEALKQSPALNAEIRGENIVYHNYYDIGIAIGSPRGLVVPILRNAERMGFAEIEQAIADFARRAQEKSLELEELQGGTFTISNGGVYGSMLSTPIVNPPQSGVLGMHAIQDRAVVRDGQIVIRPMMYVALTYDHRIVDGQEAVTFLRRVKDCIETPARMLLEI